MLKALNLGCGEAKITGALNVDCSEDTKPDLLFDIRKKFPLEDNSFDEVYFFHCIEHLERFHHYDTLKEIRRVLVDNGKLFISYPEFSEILTNWLAGKDRDFYEATIYGRQKYPGDYHYSAIHTPKLIEMMKEIGFKIEKQYPEPGQSFNTVLIATKCEGYITYEELLHKEIFAK